MNQKEVWKDIPEFEGLYQVSNLGNVKSIKRTVPCRRGFRTVKEKILKPADGGNGYFLVSLWKNNKNYTKRVHKLVAMAFLNHKPDGMTLVVDHINNIKTDNRVENLQAITNRENSSKDKKNTSSQYTGVCWDKQSNKWVSRIRINGKKKYLGLFTDEYEAHLAYQTELKNITK